MRRAGAERGDFHLRDHEGLYCAGGEQYYREEEPAAGRCPEHGVPPEPVRERNWFFRLSRYTDRLLELLESGRLRVRSCRTEAPGCGRGSVGVAPRHRRRRCFPRLAP